MCMASQLLNGTVCHMLSETVVRLPAPLPVVLAMRERGAFFSNSATSPKRRQFSDGPLSHKHNRRHRSSSIPAQGPQPSLQAGKVSLSRDFHWTNSIVVGVLIKIYISAWQHECLEAARISKKHRRPPAMTDPETSMSSKVQLKENRFMRLPVKNTIATSFTGV